MSTWWNALPVLSQIMYFIAIPSTVLLLIQLVFSFIGGEDADGDASDVDIGDVDIDDVPDADIDAVDFSEMDEPPPNANNDTDLNFVGIFTFRGIVAFLASFSWSVLALRSAGIFAPIAISIGLAIGVAMMFAVAKIIQLLLKLSENGTVRFSEAIGKTGEVYIPIPAARQGEGKVLIDFQGAERECSAQTESDEAIPTGKRVYVTGYSGEILIVENIAE
ncbi:MAG: NfeD family protein [Ruminococcus sp.]|nr:NfeD family protein [Ruminococcus sp.]